jgi:hypothetical protein
LDWLISHPSGHAFTRLHKSAEKAKEFQPMTSPGEYAASVAKEYGCVPLAKAMAEQGKAFGLSEAEITQLITEEAQATFPSLSKEQAFARYTEGDRGRILWKAIDIAKSPPWGRASPYLTFSTVTPADFRPNVISGADAYDRVLDPQAALDEIAALGRKLYPSLPSNLAFARVFEDPKFSDLAARAHRRPSPTTVYEMPRDLRYAKADPVSNSEAPAYNELLTLAKEYQAAHPELTEAQAFEKVYTDPANKDISKRERMESAPR